MSGKTNKKYIQIIMCANAFQNCNEEHILMAMLKVELN